MSHGYMLYKDFYILNFMDASELRIFAFSIL